MKPTRKKLNQSFPARDFELSIEEAEDTIMALCDAVEIAKEGSRADLIGIGDSDRMVAIKAEAFGENENVYATVVPNCMVLDLKVVK